MSQKQTKTELRKMRHRRVKAKVMGKVGRPRLSVFRSNRHMVAQIIDDEKNKSLIQMIDTKLELKKKATKTEKAFELGKKIAEIAKQKKIKQVVFDRGGYQYHGRIKAVADGAREGGLQF